jgi:diguanylate cyclase (GGDEF)-like protein
MKLKDSPANPLVDFLLASELLFCALLDTEGIIRAHSPGVPRLLHLGGDDCQNRPLAAHLTETDGEQLRRRLAGGDDERGEEFLLNLQSPIQGPTTLRCRLVRHPRGVLFVAENPVAKTAALSDELLQLNNQLAVLSRENTRKNRELEERNRQLREANRTIEELALKDPLTGTVNRRAFNERLRFEAERGLRMNSPLVLVMLDLDHFKTVNDDYGHETGDRVLVAIADTLIKAVRPYDLVARIGGEEIALLLPGTDLERGVEVAERLRREVAERVIDGYPKRITASFGVALLPPGGNPERLMSRADAALYRAKDGGRDRVERENPPQ